MHREYFNIWNEFGVEPKFGKHNPCLDKLLFFQNIGKPKIEISNDEKHYQYNCLILEIATN